MQLKDNLYRGPPTHRTFSRRPFQEICLFVNFPFSSFQRTGALIDLSLLVLLSGWETPIQQHFPSS